MLMLFLYSLWKDLSVNGILKSILQQTFMAFSGKELEVMVCSYDVAQELDQTLEWIMNILHRILKSKSKKCQTTYFYSSQH